MPAAIICTSCNRPLRVPESVLGQTVQCPLCLDEIVAQPDPAAEAAARAAEPPRRAAAPKPPPVPATTQTSAEPPVLEFAEEPPAVEAIPEVLPAGTSPAARQNRPARAFVFPVLVTRDPDRVLRGRMDGELTGEGLYLRRTRMSPAFAAVGGRARYLGTNRLVVTVEGREVELNILKPWTSNYHLARDTAAFLNGKGGFPEARTYRIPWYLFALPFLFIALPFTAAPFGLLTDGCLGAFLWTVAAFALAGATLIVAYQARLRPRTRLRVAACLLGVGVLLPLIAIPFTPSYTVDPSLWRTYTSPDGDFTVSMPGTPTVYEMWPSKNLAGGRRYVVDVQNPEVQFAVLSAPVRPNNVNGFVGNNLQDAEQRLQGEYSSAGSSGFSMPYLQAQRSGWQYGQSVTDLTYLVYCKGVAEKTLAARVVVVNNWSYTLAVFGPRVRLDGPDVVTFFNSARFTRTAKATPAPPPSPKDFPGLLAYWSFDQNQGGVFPDESGHNLKGTNHGATIIADGRRGSAMRFNGQAGVYFDFNSAPGLNFAQGGEFTFCGWVRTGDIQGTVFSNRGSKGRAPDIDLVLENGGHLSVEERPDGNEAILATSVASAHEINDGQWHHFAVRRTAAGAIGLFIDGGLAGEHQDFQGAAPITTNLHTLGAELLWQRPGAFQANSTFTGDIDEFCIYGRALSAEEIQKLAGAAGR